MQKRLKGLLTVMFLGLFISSNIPQTVLAVNLDERYEGEYDANNPLTWSQSLSPYAQDYFGFCPEGTIASCGCGVHAFAYLMHKTGVYSPGKTVPDAYKDLTGKNMISQVGEYPSYSWGGVSELSGGKVKFIGADAGGNYQTVVDNYKEGIFQILSVNVGSISHLIAVDYVDEEDNVVILDSALRAKYLDAMNGGGVTRIDMFEVEGLKAYDAPKIWEGESSSGSNTSDDEGDSSSGGGTFNPMDFDPFVPLDNPIVTYNEDDLVNQNTNKKGLSGNKTSWLDWLIGK